MARPSRRRPDGPEDANPLNRRLPAEVVARRRPVSKAAPLHAHDKEEPASVTTELRQVLTMKPDHRAKWLSKALQQAQDGRIDTKALYDIIAHAKFANDLNEKAGRRMYRLVHANLNMFSNKQHRFLETDSQLALQYAKTAFSQPDADTSKAEAAATAMEEMMARCRAFVREKQHERGEREAKDGEELLGSEADASPQPDAGAAHAEEQPAAAAASETKVPRGSRSRSKKRKRSSSAGAGSDKGGKAKQSKAASKDARRRARSSSSSHPARGKGRASRRRSSSSGAKRRRSRSASEGSGSRKRNGRHKEKGKAREKEKAKDKGKEKARSKEKEPAERAGSEAREASKKRSRKRRGASSGSSS